MLAGWIMVLVKGGHGVCRLSKGRDLEIGSVLQIESYGASHSG